MRHASPVSRIRTFNIIFALACAIALAVAACGDSGPPATGSATGGSGGDSSAGGNNLGGFEPTAGPGGNGAAGGEGGSGTLSYQWGKVMGGTGVVTPRDVAIDSAGNIILVGAFTGNIELGGSPLANAGQTDAFVAKYSATGGHLWSFSYCKGEDQGALAVAVDANNNIAITGNFKGSMSIAGGAAITASGNGMFPDVYVVQLDSNGDHVHSSPYGVGAGNNDSGNAIATDSSGNIIFAGRFANTINFGGGDISSGGSGVQSLFLAKLTSGGGYVYGSSFGDLATQEAHAVAASPSNDMAVAGVSEGSIDFGGGNITNSAGPRATVAKLDSAGSHMFSYLFAGGESRVNGLSFHSNGDLVVAGHFRQSIDIGTTTINAQGGAADIFVARFDTTGSTVYAARFGDQAKDQASATVVDAQDFAFVTGTFDGDLRVNSGQTLTAAATQDAFLLRVGPSGNGYAAVSANAEVNAQGHAVAYDAGEHSVVYVGNAIGNIDLGGGTLAADAAAFDLFIAKYTP